MDAMRQSLADWFKESQTKAEKKMGTNYAGLPPENDDGGREIEVVGEGTQAKEMSKLLPEMPALQVFDEKSERVFVLKAPLSISKGTNHLICSPNPYWNALKTHCNMVRVYKLHENEYGKCDSKFENVNFLRFLFGSMLLIDITHTIMESNGNRRGGGSFGGGDSLKLLLTMETENLMGDAAADQLMLSPTPGTFGNREELITYVREFDVSQGYVVTVKKSKRDRRVIRGCDRGVNDAQQAQGTMFNQSQRSNGGLQTDDGVQRKFSIDIFAMKGQGDGSSNRVVEVPFATAQELKVPVKEVAQERAENTENKGSDILRTKIWEALGTVSTPTKQVSNSQNLKTCTDNLQPELNSDKKKSYDVKPRQNSDTIESDSGSPNHTMKRPVTRSLTWKKPTKVQQRKAKNAPSSSNKHKQPEKTIFPFNGHSRKINSATIGGSVSKSEKKKSSRTEPRKLHFSKLNNADETRKVTDSSKKEDHMESSSGFKNGIGGLCGSSLKGNRDTYQKGNRDAYQYPILENTDNLGDNYESMFRENVDEEDMVPSLKNIVEPQFDFTTPTLGMKPTTESYFCGSSPKNNQGKQEGAHSSMKGLKEVSNMENIWSFKSFFASTPESDKKKKETEISDDEVVHGDPHAEKSLPSLKETNTINSPSTSSSEEDGCESSDGGSSTEGPSEAGTPEIVTAQDPECLFRQTKRCRISEGADATIFNPSSTPPQVFGKFHGVPSELNEEDGLARAVSLFAMVLERVKSRMKSVVNKKSAEILTSVAMEMQLQLQNAELQIQKDVGKLTGIGKTKRRRLETRFQEQQGKLEDIYERFRNEVNMHLQDCKNTLEGLELQQTEFKDIVEEQNASHCKLLIQVEEAINTRLNDAQKRINTVQKSARQKMLQLKYVIAECLKEDALY